MLPSDERFERELSAAEKCKLFDVPGVELKFEEEYEEGDLIIYNSWLGQIEATYDEVTLRLSDNSVVTVDDPTELEEDVIPLPPDLVTAHTELIDSCYVGQVVTTKKGNLRRGRWKFGRYNPSVPPRGYVVEVRVVQIDVHWITQNVLAEGVTNQTVPRPPSLLGLDDLESGDVTFYRRDRQPGQLSATQVQLGFTGGSDIAVGDHVRFKDITAAAAKYDGTNTTRTGIPKGRIERIPRAATAGFDVNVFKVIGTQTQVSVLWQDLSLTQDPSADLLPYLNVDDHDVWPGEIVALKENKLTTSDVQAAPLTDSVHRPQKVGVVQSVDAAERMACVRWYNNSAVELAGKEKSIFIPGSRLGILSDDIEDISFYEIITYSGLTKRRGDFVLVAPEQSTRLDDFGAEITRLANSINASAASAVAVRAADQAAGPATRNSRIEQGLFRSLLSRFVGFAGPETQGAPLASGLDASATTASNDIISPSRPQVNGQSSNPSLNGSHLQGPVDWFGEIIDLGLDGLLTVRLGALEEVQDVRVPLERVVVVLGGDGDEPDDTDVDGSWDDEVSDDSRSSGYSSEEAIEEIIEYEGGQRIDGDGGDEMWTTDDEDVMDTTSEVDLSRSPSSVDSDDIQSEEDGSSPNNVQQDETKSDRAIGVAESTSSETHLSAYPSGPASFSVLDTDPPLNHHFLRHKIDLTANRMRRIQKEHKILNSSLPDGIFVRTWEARLDLLRVLIIGSRNTPYELAPFVIDFNFGPSFPSSPPDAYFHSWTNGIGRINPNLYEDGKICLSLLGTWRADAKNEGWSSTRSSMLQVLVSLMGLVLVKEPYYNEAGFDALVGTEESQVTSAQYTERALVMSKGFVRHALQQPVGGLEDVLSWLYLPGHGERPLLLQKVIEDSKGIVRVSETKLGEGAQATGGRSGNTSSEGVPRVSAGALVLLRKHILALEECLKRAQEENVA